MNKMVEEGWSGDDVSGWKLKDLAGRKRPYNDVDGIDAAYKMVILSQFVFA